MIQKIFLDKMDKDELAELENNLLQYFFDTECFLCHTRKFLNNDEASFQTSKFVLEVINFYCMINIRNSTGFIFSEQKYFQVVLLGYFPCHQIHSIPPCTRSEVILIPEKILSRQYMLQILCQLVFIWV